MVRAAGSTIVWQLFIVLISLFFVAVYARVCEQEDFAIYMLAQGLIGISALMDLGLSRSLLYYLSKYKFVKSRHAALTNGALGLVIVVVGLSCAGTALLTFIIGLMLDFSRVFWFVTATVLVCLMFVLLISICTTIMEASSSFFQVARIRFISAFLSYLLPLISYVYLGNAREFEYLLYGLIASRLCLSIITWSGSGLRIESNPFRNWKETQLLFRYGRWVGISNVLGIGFSQFDRLILTTISGLTALAAYIPFSDVVQKASMLSNSLFKIVFVTSIKAGRVTAIELHRATIMLLALLLIPLVVVGFYSETIITVWLGENVQNDAVTIMRILMLSLWVKLFAQYFVNKLYEYNLGQLVTVNHAIEIIPYVIFLAVGALIYGAIGVAIVVLLREIIDATLTGLRLISRTNLFSSTAAY